MILPSKLINQFILLGLVFLFLVSSVSALSTSNFGNVNITGATNMTGNVIIVGNTTAANISGKAVYSKDSFVENAIYHVGDLNTFISFITDAFNFTVGGRSVVEMNATDVAINDNLTVNGHTSVVYNLTVAKDIIGQGIFYLTGKAWFGDDINVTGNVTSENFNGPVVADTVLSTGNITSLKDVNVSQNLYASILYGQPLTGMLGSGVIAVSEKNPYAETNITCASLNCSWSSFKVRLVNTSNVVKYCDIASGSKVVTDNQHDVLYIDNNCAIQETSIQTYIATPISPGGIADFANIIAYNGNTTFPNGIGLENKRIIKLRKLLLETMHLEVVNGFSVSTGTWRNFNISTGKYVYLMDIVNATKKSSESIELIFRSPTGWTHSETNLFNVSSCDNGTSDNLCTNTNRYRRIFIFDTGYGDGIDYTELHQLLPREDTSYTTPADCLNTVTNPITYTLPSYYEYSAVMLYAYCARASDSVWTTNFIDLRSVKTATATGTIDTSVFLTIDGSRSLTSNWNAGLYNITASEFSGNLRGNILQNTNVTEKNLTSVECIHFKTGGMICSGA